MEITRVLDGNILDSIEDYAYGITYGEDDLDICTRDFPDDMTFRDSHGKEPSPYGNIEGFYKSSDVQCPNCGYKVHIGNMKMFGVCDNCGTFTNQRDDYMYKP